MYSMTCSRVYWAVMCRVCRNSILTLTLANIMLCDPCICGDERIIVLMCVLYLCKPLLMYYNWRLRGFWWNNSYKFIILCYIILGTWQNVSGLSECSECLYLTFGKTRILDKTNRTDAFNFDYCQSEISSFCICTVHYCDLNQQKKTFKKYVN